MSEVKYQRPINYMGNSCVVACDGQCHKAFGIQERPRLNFDPADADDHALFSDQELGLAPERPMSFEGGEGKPILIGDVLNKWCVRQCERSQLEDIDNIIVLPDFSKRIYNQPWKHLDLLPEEATLTMGAEYS